MVRSVSRGPGLVDSGLVPLQSRGHLRRISWWVWIFAIASTRCSLLRTLRVQPSSSLPTPTSGALVTYGLQGPSATPSQVSRRPGFTCWRQEPPTLWSSLRDGGSCRAGDFRESGGRYGECRALCACLPPGRECRNRWRIGGTCIGDYEERGGSASIYTFRLPASEFGGRWKPWRCRNYVWAFNRARGPRCGHGRRQLGSNRNYLEDSGGGLPSRYCRPHEKIRAGRVRPHYFRPRRPFGFAVVGSFGDRVYKMDHQPTRRKDELLLCGRRQKHPEAEEAQRHSRKGYAYRKEGRERRKSHHRLFSCQPGDDHGDHPQLGGADFSDVKKTGGPGGTAVGIPSSGNSSCPAALFNSRSRSTESPSYVLGSKGFGEKAQDQGVSSCRVVGVDCADKACGGSGVGEREDGRLRGQLSSGSTCPITGPDNACEPNSQQPAGPHVRLDLFQQLGFYQRCNWEGKASSRTSPSKGHLLSGGASFDDSEDVTVHPARSSASNSARERSDRDQISGKVWRIRSLEGVGTPTMAGYDHLRSAHGREFACGKGCDSTPCCHSGARCDGQREARHRLPAMPAGGATFFGVQHEECRPFPPQSSLRSSCGPAMDYGRLELHERDGGDWDEETRVHSDKNFYHPRRSGPYPKAKAKAETEGKRQRTRKSERRGGGCLNHEKAADGEGLESNPLQTSISFVTWALSMPRWILRVKTKFSWFLLRSFNAGWQADSLPTASLPLPVPYQGCFGPCGGPGLSKKKLLRLARKRLVHMMVMVINQQYLGRAPRLDEIRRRPNSWQLQCFRRLESLLLACGADPGPFPLAPGRAGPQLGACLFQLEQFILMNPELLPTYGGFAPKAFREDGLLFPKEKYPQLAPYKSLDVSRLKLVGTGQWPMEEFMDSVLWIPFREPAFLLHGQKVRGAPLPNLAAESREENLVLAKVWDAKSLLRLHAAPLCPGHFSRVFNAFKSESQDRQIGDRRIPNSRERHISGPSRFLPPGSLLTTISVPRFSHGLLGSVTDRRDYYHQARVTSQRSQSNLLPFPFSREELRGTKALAIFEEEEANPKAVSRESAGDGLAQIAAGKIGVKASLDAGGPQTLYAGFASLFQGDHLGVEFALQSHEQLLVSEDLLEERNRLRGHHLPPEGPNYEALIIDDYFAIGAHPISRGNVNSFASEALARARVAYAKHNLEGSIEKDVEASVVFKAAGAEVISRPEDVRRGCVCVGAPIRKRLALAALTLRAARLPGITAGLASRLSGNWVSALLFRRCLASVVDAFFALGACGEKSSENVIFPLSRSVAEELQLLAISSPWMTTNVAVGFSRTVYASDASLAAGAYVSCEVGDQLSRTLWLSSDRKGYYTRLDGLARSMLASVGEEPFDDVYEEVEELSQTETPFKPPLFYYDFVEICGGSGVLSKEAADLGLVVAPVLDLSESEHFNLCDVNFLAWIFHMFTSRRFRSTLLAPPCTTFSAAAWPDLRSYENPLGYCRTHPRTLLGNILAFRSLSIMFVCALVQAPSGLEQPRLSKMAWLACWRFLLSKGFTESVVASCQFGSPHKKEFRILSHMLSQEDLEVKCPGGHLHVPIQGKFTKPSAIYTPGVARHIAGEFKRSLEKQNFDRRDEGSHVGFESLVVNDLLCTADWVQRRLIRWRRKSHINVLELSTAVSLLEDHGRAQPDSRLVGCLDSKVAIGALAKGRSSSSALQPLCKRACATQVSSGTYPGWVFAPTRLNIADDPTRSKPVRSPLSHSILQLDFLDLRELSGVRLRRPYANWIRLLLLLALIQPSYGFSLNFPAHSPKLLSSWILLGLFVLQAVVLSSSPCQTAGTHGQPRRCNGRYRPFPVKMPLVLVVLSVCFCHVCAMEPLTSAERERALRRASTELVPSRVVRPQTRASRQKLLGAFRTWLYEEHDIQMMVLLSAKPADPEEICRLLVAYGQQLFLSGKAYGIYAETINAVAASRPLIRKQLTGAWDLAFAWLADEPHSHHPALPVSVLLSLMTVCITWGWATEAAIFGLTWAGLLRIGETLLAKRGDLVLPRDSAPGTKFLLLKIHMPKTRGRSAKHQSARVDPHDIVVLVDAVFGALPADSKLWPFSAQTLRNRFSQALEALHLPTTRSGSQRPFDLGSLRPGGATFLLNQTEDSELCRRRGRWISNRVMEIYLQEVLVATYVQRLRPDVRNRISFFAAAFPGALQKALEFLHLGIPQKAWHVLFACSSTWHKGAWSMGVGGTFGQQHFQKGLLHDVPRFPARKECGVLDFKLTIDVCISSSPALLCEIPPFVWSVLELLGSSISKKDCCMMYLVSLQEKNAVCLYNVLWHYIYYYHMTFQSVVKRLFTGESVLC